MNCREFISEFEERGELSSLAQVHLNDCPGCRKTTIVQTHIWQAIDVLPKVNAPSNFDFRVKARIADGKPSDLQPRFLPVLRYGLPFSAVVLISGLLAFNTNVFFGGDAAPQVATVAPSTQTAAENPPVNLPSATVPGVGNSSLSQSFTDERYAVTNANQNVRPLIEKNQPQFVAANLTKKLPLAPRRESAKEILNGGGSRDLTYTERKALMPEGIPSSRPKQIEPNVGNAPINRSADIWSFVGIVVVSENGRQTIRAVKPNSLAARVDLQVGDVIEAVNGVKLAAQSLSALVVEIKTLTVLRGTERIEIGFNK